MTDLSVIAVPRLGNAKWILPLLIILVMGTVLMSLAWVGYVGSDDHSYAEGALGWLSHFPYVGDDHWTLRHTVVIPLAAALGLFGMHEINLGLPSALLFLATLAVNYYYVNRFVDARLAL